MAEARSSIDDASCERRFFPRHDSGMARGTVWQCSFISSTKLKPCECRNGSERPNSTSRFLLVKVYPNRRLNSSISVCIRGCFVTRARKLSWAKTGRAQPARLIPRLWESTGGQTGSNCLLIRPPEQGCGCALGFAGSTYRDCIKAQCGDALTHSGGQRP